MDFCNSNKINKWMVNEKQTLNSNVFFYNTNTDKMEGYIFSDACFIGNKIGVNSYNNTYPRKTTDMDFADNYVMNSFVSPTYGTFYLRELDYLQYISLNGYSLQDKYVKLSNNRYKYFDYTTESPYIDNKS